MFNVYVADADRWAEQTWSFTGEGRCWDYFVASIWCQRKDGQVTRTGTKDTKMTELITQQVSTVKLAVFFKTFTDFDFIYTLGKKLNITYM